MTEEQIVAFNTLYFSNSTRRHWRRVHTHDATIHSFCDKTATVCSPPHHGCSVSRAEYVSDHQIQVTEVRKKIQKMAADVACCESKFFMYVVIIVGLVGFAGLMAGLTLGLMSLGLVDLEVLIRAGRPQDRIHAGKRSSFFLPRTYPVCF